VSLEVKVILSVEPKIVELVPSESDNLNTVPASELPLPGPVVNCVKVADVAAPVVVTEYEVAVSAEL